MNFEQSAGKALLQSLLQKQKLRLWNAGDPSLTAKQVPDEPLIHPIDKKKSEVVLDDIM